MKRKTIWFIGIIIGISFIVLLVMQMRNAIYIAQLRKSEFEENVTRSLSEATREMEQQETLRYLESVTKSHAKALDSTSAASLAPGTVGAINLEDSTSLFQLKKIKTDTIGIGQLSLTMHRTASLSQENRDFLEMVKNAYVYQHSVLDEVIYTILYNASKTPLKDRVDFPEFGQRIKAALADNGITLGFHYKVLDANGNAVYKCVDFEETPEEKGFEQDLFPNNTGQKTGTLVVYFPEERSYIMGIRSYIAPMMIFTLILFATFLLTIWLIVRQKRISEMKNDFINNMTHEFKTPLSSISLAAQMLTDKSINKSPAMYDNLAGIISTESKRLRFQVEKVLQMSLFEHNNISFKLTDLDVNDMIDTVVNTFTLKVTQCGGSINTKLEAYDPFVMADEMHMTNVIFNLLDNAVKYRNHDRDLKLNVTTENQGENLVITIEDNGIGMKKEDLKRIFEKFYRVHTGNQHDVKGFGLGLAYVNKIVELHHGTIKADSELDKGTKFTITLPNTKD